MTVSEAAYWLLSFPEDQDKEVSVGDIPFKAKITDMSMGDDGSKYAQVYYSGELEIDTFKQN